MVEDNIYDVQLVDIRETRLGTLETINVPEEDRLVEIKGYLIDAILERAEGRRVRCLFAAIERDVRKRLYAKWSMEVQSAMRVALRGEATWSHVVMFAALRGTVCLRAAAWSRFHA